jgi:hypothetical protein
MIAKLFIPTVPHFLDSSNLIKNMTLSVSPELDITVKKLTKITKTLYLKRKKKKNQKSTKTIINSNHLTKAIKILFN